MPTAMRECELVIVSLDSLTTPNASTLAEVPGIGIGFP